MENVKKCKTCKHWDDSEVSINYYFDEAKHDKCLICGDVVEGYHYREKHLKEKHKDLPPVKFGKCKNDKLIIDWPHMNIASDCLLYCDGEEYSVSLSVGQNFGCVHHEVKS